MAYDEGLAERIRTALRRRDDVLEKKMFGGITFMVAGRMAFGVVRNDLMVRVGPDGHDWALTQPGTRPMDFTGKPVRGMVYVAPEVIASEGALRQWLDRAIAVATNDGGPATSRK